MNKQPDTGDFIKALLKLHNANKNILGKHFMESVIYNVVLWSTQQEFNEIGKH